MKSLRHSPCERTHPKTQSIQRSHCLLQQGLDGDCYTGCCIQHEVHFLVALPQAVFGQQAFVPTAVWQPTSLTSRCQGATTVHPIEGRTLALRPLPQLLGTCNCTGASEVRTRVRAIKSHFKWVSRTKGGREPQVLWEMQGKHLNAGAMLFCSSRTH